MVEVLSNADLQGGADLEGLVNACWDMYTVLKRGGCKMNYSRHDLSEMVNGMLVWGSPALGFLRRVRVIL